MKIITILFLTLFSSSLFSSEPSCEGCYTIKLNFDIEGHGYEKSAIFISGYTYALGLHSSALKQQGKENYFCKNSPVKHQEVLEILNANLSGVVSADLVAETIPRVLKEKYPCK